MSQQTVDNELFSCPRSFITNIDQQLPNILKSLDDGTNKGAFSEVLKFLFCHDSVLSQFSIDDLETKLLKPTLVWLHKIFSKNLNRVLNLVENSEDSDEEVYFTLCGILQDCLNILGGYYDLIEYLLKIPSLKSNNVESLMKTLPGILLDSFSHCKGSENNYGSYFSMLTEVLTSIFRKSYEVSSIFYKLLDEQVTFDCNFENDFVLLVTVLEILCSIGEVVVTLDSKTMVDQWKVIAKLISKYSTYLKDRFNISQPINFLISCLENTITAITSEQEEGNSKLRNRNLKLGSFILKIIVKLCELYSGYLASAVTNILKLLLLLNRCSRLYKQDYNDELDRFIVVGAGPLLSHVVKDQQFVEVFKKSIENCDSAPIEEKIGLFYTHLRLFKLLINSCDSEDKENWLNISLVPSIINTYSKSYEYLDLTVKIEDNDAYTTLVSSTVAFVISNYTCDKFIPLEQYLIAHLFEPDVEVSILISDILTLLCRLTNEEVCLRETIYLCYALSQISSYNIRPEVSVVRLTTARLYSILSKSGQERVEKGFPMLTHIWKHVGVKSPEICVSQLSQINDSMTPLEFVKLVEWLYIACQSSINTEKKVNDALISTFKRILFGFHSCSSSIKQADWWYTMFDLLTKTFLNIAPCIDDTTFDESLRVISELTSIGEPSAIYYTSKIVTDLLGQDRYLANLDAHLNKIVNIFKICSSSSDIFIKQMFVERFISVKNLSNSDAFLELDNETQNYILEYSKKRPTIYSDKSINSVQVDYLHKCFECAVENGDCPPHKKFKQDVATSKISEPISTLQKSVDNLIQYACQNTLSLEEKDLVNLCIFKLGNV